MEPQETPGSQPWSQWHNGKQTAKSVKPQSPNENVQLGRGESDCVKARRVSSVAGTQRYAEEMMSKAGMVSRGRG